MSRKKRQQELAGSPVSESGETDNYDKSGSTFATSCISLFFLAAFAWAAYANSLNVPFVFDDVHSIEENQSLRGLSLDPESWKRAAFSHPLPRPVAYLSFAFNFAVGGESVVSFHVTNIIIHILCGWLVFALAMMLGPRLGGAFLQSGHNQTFFAFSVAILFLLSPVQTQAVTYIVQRMASMCAMFYLAAVLCYVLGRVSVRRQWIWWTASLLLWGLALGTKQNAATLPFAILLIEWLAFRDASWGWLQRRWPVIVAVLVAFVAVAFLYKGGKFQALFENGARFRNFTAWERLLTQSRVVCDYVSLIAFPLPSRLQLTYDIPISNSLWSPMSTLICTVAIMATLIVSFVFASRYRIAAFAVIWFLLHLAVESTIIPLELVYEHRIYLPLVGPAILFVYCLCRSVASLKVRWVIILLLALLYGIGTHTRNLDWRTNVSIWADNVVKDPTNSRAHFNLAVNLKLEEMKLEPSTLNTERYEQSMLHFSRAIEIDGNYLEAYARRGTIWEARNQFDLALADYSKAVSGPPRKTNRFFRKKQHEVHFVRGRILVRLNRHEEAIADLTNFLMIEPKFNGLNESLTEEQVEKLLPEELQIYTGNRPQMVGECFYQRALARTNLRQFGKAVQDYARAINFLPQNGELLNNYAFLLAACQDESIQNGPLAVGIARRAVNVVVPTNYSVHDTLAAALARAGEFSDAIESQERAIELAPASKKESLQNRLRLYQDGQTFKEL